MMPNKGAKSREKNKNKVPTYRRPQCLRPQRYKHVPKPNAAVTNTKSGRQLADCPFYHYQYGFDTLPLDPAKSFLIEKMCTCFFVLFITIIYYIIM